MLQQRKELADSSALTCVKVAGVESVINLCHNTADTGLCIGLNQLDQKCYV